MEGLEVRCVLGRDWPTDGDSVDQESMSPPTSWPGSMDEKWC